MVGVTSADGGVRVEERNFSFDSLKSRLDQRRRKKPDAVFKIAPGRPPALPECSRISYRTRPKAV